MFKKITLTVAAGIIALGTVATTTAVANEKVITDPSIFEQMKTRAKTVQDEITQTECGDCHMVFPPSRLTGNAWVKIMSNLGDHFGDDATLDGASVKHIQDYLVKSALDRPGKNGKIGIRTKMRLAAWKKKGVVDPIRITETPEWTRHHTKERHYLNMIEAVGYKAGSNCIQCHKGAEHGLYEEFDGLYGGR